MQPIPSFYKFTEITSEGLPHRVFQNNKKEPSSFSANFFNYFNSQSRERSYTFFTSREEKFQEVCKLLQGLTVLRHDKDLPTRENEENIVYLAVYHVFKAYKQCKTPCFTEEASLLVENDEFKQPWPGHYWRHTVENQMGKSAFAKKYQGRTATTCSAIAYTEDGATAHVFKDEIKGTIVLSEKWDDSEGWDPFFQPSGHSQTLANLQQFKHIFNMRLMSCAEMRSVMRGKDYPGVYEVHITLENDKNPIPSDEYVQKFKKICTTLGQKPLEIEMDDPNKPMQLQTAAYYVFEGYSDAVKKTFELANTFLKKEFRVLRVRIEAMLHNQDSPKTDDEALNTKECNYFELHARLHEVTKEGFKRFQEILKEYNLEAIGSHKKGKITTVHSTVGGGSRFFVNLRGYNIGAETSLIYWRRLLAKLESENFKIAKEVKPEYCIYDEKPMLDQEVYTQPMNM